MIGIPSNVALQLRAFGVKKIVKACVCNILLRASVVGRMLQVEVWPVQFSGRREGGSGISRQAYGDFADDRPGQQTWMFVHAVWIRKDSQSVSAVVRRAGPKQVLDYC